MLINDSELEKEIGKLMIEKSSLRKPKKKRLLTVSSDQVSNTLLRYNCNHMQEKSTITVTMTVTDKQKKNVAVNLRLSPDLSSYARTNTFLLDKLYSRS